MSRKNSPLNNEQVKFIAAALHTVATGVLLIFGFKAVSDGGTFCSLYIAFSVFTVFEGVGLMVLKLLEEKSDD